MSAKRTVIKIAKEKEIPTRVISEWMGYSDVSSLYRALSNPNQISYKRLKLLSEALKINFNDIRNILK